MLTILWNSHQYSELVRHTVILKEQSLFQICKLEYLRFIFPFSHSRYKINGSVSQLHVAFIYKSPSFDCGNVHGYYMRKGETGHVTVALQILKFK